MEFYDITDRNGVYMPTSSNPVSAAAGIEGQDNLWHNVQQLITT